MAEIIWNIVISRRGHTRKLHAVDLNVLRYPDPDTRMHAHINAACVRDVLELLEGQL